LPLRSPVVALGLAALGLAAAPAAVRSPSLVRIAKGPAGTTTEVEAQFRFPSAAASLSCRRDAQPYRRCRASVKYTGLRAGPHLFEVRARMGGLTTVASRSWSVVKAPGATGSYAPSTGPDPVLGAPARRLIFADDFTGTRLNPAAWRAFDGPGHDGHGLRRSSAVKLDGAGHLVLTARSSGGRTISGALANRRDFRYGRLVFRVRTEADPTGTMSGEVFTWPVTQSVPQYTESDVYSTGQVVDNHAVFSSFVHFDAQNLQKVFHHNADPTQWHTMVMDWTPDRLDVLRDGALVWSIADRRVIPDVLQHVSIQLDARTGARLRRPVRMLVDYVRIYR
jgi:hypothetical protein